MVNPIGTSLAGLQVASRRIEVASQNLANQQSRNYEPQRVVQSNDGGVPVANVETVANPTQKFYQPDSPDADEYGFVNMPNVDQAEQLIDMKVASYDYKANLKAIKVQDEIQQSLLDIIT